jgi:preprotein translocase subunit SecG
MKYLSTINLILAILLFIFSIILNIKQNHKITYLRQKLNKKEHELDRTKTELDFYKGVLNKY